MKNKKKAFTLIEILVVISMIMILLVGFSKIDISKGQNQQKSLGFSQKIQTPIETTITNALIGKGVGTNLLVPKSWKIKIKKELVNGGTGSVEILYESGSSYISYEKINADKNYELRSIDCLDINGNPTDNIEELNITIKGSNLDVGSSCNGKQIRLISQYKKEFPYVINLNTISGVLTKNSIQEVGKITYGTSSGQDGICGTNSLTCDLGNPITGTTNLCGSDTTWTCEGYNGGTSDSCSYSNPPCPINGVCGSATSIATLTAPSTNLCSAGNPSSVTSGTYTFDWQCIGLYGGTTSNCSTYKKQTASCGSIPSGSIRNTATTITQTWNGTTWTPSTTPVYNTTASTIDCRYKCNTGYIWDGNSCAIIQTWTKLVHNRQRYDTGDWQCFAGGRARIGLYNFTPSSGKAPDYTTTVSVIPSTAFGCSVSGYNGIARATCTCSYY